MQNSPTEPTDKPLIIAIDGPAGAGKSTIARNLARRLGYLFINTGAMYRAVAWLALQQGIALDDAASLGRLAAESELALSGTVDAMRVAINGRDVTEDIVRPAISEAASKVSTIPAVRRALVALQQALGRQGGVVMEGRDIGTHVFPNAEIKIYLDATAQARAERRCTQDAARGLTGLSFEQVKTEIERRDERDKTRADSPLRQAADAIYLDSSHLTIDEVTEQILSLVKSYQTSPRG